MARTEDPGYDPAMKPAPFPDNPNASAFEEQPNLDAVIAFPAPPAEGSLVDRLIGEKSEVGQAMVRFVSGSGGRDASQPGTQHSQADVRDPQV